MTSRIVAGVMVATSLIFATLSALASSPAAAVGDPTLNGYLISTPGAGWVQLPPARVELYVTTVQTVESSFLKASGAKESVAVAAQGWLSPSGARSMMVVLTSYSSSIPNANLKSFINGFCLSATGSAPVTTASDPAVPGALWGTCSSTTTTGQPFNGSAESVIEGNVLIGVESIGGSGARVALLSSATLRQTEAIPASGVPVGSGSNWLLPVVIVLLVVAASTATFLVLKRRSPAPAVVTGSQSPRDEIDSSSEPLASLTPSPSVGWHPDGDDGLINRYWDGSSWTQCVRWNGTEWIPHSQP